MHDRNLEPVYLILLGIVALLLILLIIVLIRFLRRTSSQRRAKEMAAVTDSSNKQQFMMATFQGVIQRLKEQERELERLHRLEKERADLSEKISENVTRNMPTGLITISRSGIITSSNPVAKEIVALKLLENMHYRQVIPSHSAFNEMIEDCLQTGKRYHRAEIEVTFNNSVNKTLGISVSPIESGKEEISGVVCLISDLTELVALQKQVHMKEGLATLGEMSAGIAHEFKNSLATICGYAQFLREEEIPPSAKSSITAIWKEASQLTATVNEFLNFAKPQQLNRKELDLCELLRDCVDEMKLNPRFKEMNFGFLGRPQLYEGDELLLKSAFGNLLLNAAESIPSAGATGSVSCHLQNSSNLKRHRILIRFKDNGCGIKGEDIEKIFIPFFTTKREGTGLGLAIVQKIVLLHDGRIEVESTPGQGTCFNIYL